MANYQNLKAAISAAIRTNGNQEITGQVLQNVLNSIVSVIGANYTFAGVATPATNPGTPDQNVFYIATQGGTYTNFGATALPEGISLLMWNGSWTAKTIMYNDGGVFDISVYKSTGGTLAKFADLGAALGTNGANIPAAARKGGMSVKYVQTSDNKYVQYRLTAEDFSTTESDWQITGDGVFDISAYTNSVYASFDAAIVNVPEYMRKGGITVRFILRTGSGTAEDPYVDEYVQYSLMRTVWSTIQSYWQGVDDVATEWSNNIIKSKCVYDNKINLQNSFSTSAQSLIWVNGVLKQDGTIDNIQGWETAVFFVNDIDFFDITGNIQQLSSPYCHVCFYRERRIESSVLISYLSLNKEGSIIKSYNDRRVLVPNGTQLITVSNSSNLKSTISIKINNKNTEPFDISIYTAVSGTLPTYQRLDQALGTNGANVPIDIRRGGMSIKYIDSTSGKYVQWRYMGTVVTDDAFTTISDWQGVDNEARDSDNLIKSKCVYETNSNLSNSIRTKAQSFSLTDGALSDSGGILNITGWKILTFEVTEREFIELTGNIQMLGDGFYHVCFYKSRQILQETFISGIRLNTDANVYYNNKRIIVPKDTQLVAICDSESKISSISININDTNKVFEEKSDSLISNTILDAKGQLISFNGFNTTDYIYIEGNTQVVFDKTFNGVTDDYSNIAFYDCYGNLISRDSRRYSIWDIPQNAIYMRYCTMQSSMSHTLINNASGIYKSNVIPPSNIYLSYQDFDYTVSGVNFKKSKNILTINGAVSEDFLNASVYYFPLNRIIQGHKYRFIYHEQTDVYFQYMDSNTSWQTLSNGHFDFEIAEGVTDVKIRLLVNRGSTFDNVDVYTELVDITKEEKVVNVSTAAQLYDFLYNFSEVDENTKLILAPGVYDLYTGLFENYILSDSMHFNMNDYYLKDIEIVGNNAILQLKVPAFVNAAHSSSVSTVSILNVRGGVYIHNLTLEAENCRYACHDETQSDEDIWYAEHRYENVTFKFNHSDATAVNGGKIAIGIGGNMGQRYIFKNCKFERTGLPSTTSEALYIHGRVYNIASVEFYNCIFTSVTERVCQFAQYTGNDKETQVIMNNCFIDGVVLSSPQTNSGFTKQQWVFNLFNSYCQKLLIRQTDTYPLVREPTIVNTINGTISHSYDTE